MKRPGNYYYLPLPKQFYTRGRLKIGSTIVIKSSLLLPRAVAIVVATAKNMYRRIRGRSRMC